MWNALTFLHRHVRRQQKQGQEKRQITETKERSERLPTGIRALWFRLTGQYKAIKRQNEIEAHNARTRDRNEFQTLIYSQQAERGRLQHEVQFMRFRHALGIKKLNRDMAVFLNLGTSLQKNGQQDEAAQQKNQRQQQRRNRGPTMHWNCRTIQHE